MSFGGTGASAYARISGAEICRRVCMAALGYPEV